MWDYRFVIFLIAYSYRNRGIERFWKKYPDFWPKIKKFPDFWPKIKFPDFSLTIIFFPVFPVFQTLWEPCYHPYTPETLDTFIGHYKDNHCLKTLNKNCSKSS